MAARLFVLLSVLFLGTAVARCQNADANLGLFFITPSGQHTEVFQIETARSDSERRLGLMYRRELAANAGMLFVFPDTAPRSFWMKNTYLELDMIFLDESLRVLHVIHRAMPFSESPRESLFPTRYVLELRGGQAAASGIAPGVRGVFVGSAPEAID